MFQYLQKNLAADFDNIRILYVPIFPKNADLLSKQLLEPYYVPIFTKFFSCIF